jgi:hypothetical protein
MKSAALTVSKRVWDRVEVALEAPFLTIGNDFDASDPRFLTLCAGMSEVAFGMPIFYVLARVRAVRLSRPRVDPPGSPAFISYKGEQALPKLPSRALVQNRLLQCRLRYSEIDQHDATQKRVKALVQEK